ncbi:DHH family phosphoesterase [Blattabacterium cuenoti]|uniref:DHH family phosphoesterase n=1 Tax=Blattabacterium cuenoti TaxID=1653831 RepID=UPI00163CDAB3|nr:DHH family phosphoesterase [Blattabacterium cuenoti]
MWLYNIDGKEKKTIILLIHPNPDGDALGSSLALYFYLKKLQHDVYLISPTEYSEFFRWLPGNDNIIIFSDKTESFIKKKVSNSDYLFVIDFNNLSRLYRIKNMKYLFSNYKGKTILIDHHPFPSKFDFMLFDYTVSATSILIYRLIYNMNNLDKIDKNIATCLYVGIITDTGFFRFPSVTSETHFIAIKLLDQGIDIQNIYFHLKVTYNISKLKILSQALNKIQIIDQYRTAYTSINESDMRYINSYNKSDTDGIVTYGLGIKNIVFSVFFFEEYKTSTIKISFRSIGTFDVNKFARTHFQGGGHKNAAGGISYTSLSESIDYFLNIIKKYKENLTLSI